MNFLSPISLKKTFCKTGITLLILPLFSTSQAQRDDTRPAPHLKPVINKKNIEPRDLKIASEWLQLRIPV